MELYSVVLYKKKNKLRWRSRVWIICGRADISNRNEKGIETVVIAVVGIAGKTEHTKRKKIAVADVERVVAIIIQYIFKILRE